MAAPVMLNIDRLTTLIPSFPLHVQTQIFRVYEVLRVFLHPSSNLSNVLGTVQIMNIYPSQNLDFSSLNIVVIELAQQIPYWHPAHHRLARLIWTIGRSPKRFEMAMACNIGQAIDSFYTELQKWMRECVKSPDINAPERFVNFQAFEANLMALGVWIPSAAPAMKIMRRWVFLEENRIPPPVPAVHDAYIAAGAQWIFWFGQGLCNLVIQPGDVAPDSSGPSAVNNLPRLATPLDDPDAAGVLTVARWREWRRGFAEVAEHERAGVSPASREVARRAWDIMTALEKSMLGN